MHIDYDQEIWCKLVALEGRLNSLRSKKVLTDDVLYCNSEYPKSILADFLDTIQREEPHACSSIKVQLDERPPSRIGSTSILVPVYDEPYKNLECLIESLADSECELILLFNSSKNCPKSVEERNRSVFRLVDQRYAERPNKKLKIFPIDATGLLARPSIGTARNILLWIEAYRCLSDTRWADNGFVSGRKVIMTDADCKFSHGFLKWYEGLYRANPSTIAFTANIKFKDSVDPRASEGVENEKHLVLLMIGEFFRNLIAYANEGRSNREERPWIGMGMGFTIQTAIVCGGFPGGWRRKEDHYMGAMLEAVQRLCGGSIYHSQANSPHIESIIRGSKRTDAGMGCEDKSTLSGLTILKNLTSSVTASQISALAAMIPPVKQEQILAMPTTRLLRDLLCREGACAGKRTITVYELLALTEGHMATTEMTRKSSSFA